MNKSKIEAGQPEQQNNNEPTAQNQQVSQPIANTNVVGILLGQREIKFRGKSTKNGEWFYGYYRNIGGYNFIDDEPIHPPSRGEYTGLKDKNGKEIYEGDIVQDNVGRYWVIRYDNKFCAFMFYYTKGMHQFQHYERFNKFQRPFEIIGNTFENPKLIETLQ